MAIIYTYPEINQVEGEDLLLISDTSLYKRPTRSVTIDNLAAYIGTIIGVGSVQSIDTSNTSFINMTPTMPATGNVELTASLSASGTPDNTKFLRGDNVWAEVAGIQGSGTENYTARWISADTLSIGALYDNGTQVGIGTNNPDTPLHVVGNVKIETTGSVDNLLLTSTDATLTGAPDISLFADTAAADGDTIGNIQFRGRNGMVPGSTVPLTYAAFYSHIIDKDNNQSILALTGHKGNGSGANKTVANFSVIGTNNSGEGAVLINPSSGYTPSSYNLEVNGDFKVVDDAYFDSNVGIGTTSPAEKLHVFGGAAAIEIDSTTNEASLKYDNSTTTAVIKLANNDLKTELGGSEKMRILASGNVGIGTTSPSSKFQVSANDGDGITLKHGTSNAFYILRDGNDDTIIKQTRNYTSKISISTLADSGTHESSGLNIVGQGAGLKSNVGIGTASPTSKLDVVGTGSFTGQVTIPATPVASTDAASKSYVDAQVGTADTLSEVLALGNTTGGTNIDVSPNDVIDFFTGSNLNYGRIHANSEGLNLDTVANRHMIFSKGSTEVMRISTSGNVGIGTTSPSYPLEIAQTGYGLGVKNYITSTDVANSILVGYDPAAVYLGYGYGSKEVHIGSLNSGDVKIRTQGNTIVENGNVGIGTTAPSDKLHISAGAIRLDNNYQLRWGGTGTGVYGHSTQGLNFYTNSGATRLKIENGGNVGIGTTSPSAKLEVAGDLNIGSALATVGALSNKLNFWGYTAGQGVCASIGSYRGNNYVSGGLIFETGEGTTSERMRITPTGNVGIGTTSPDAKLEVVGSTELGSSNYQIKTRTSVGNNSAIIHRKDSGGNLELRAATDDYDQLFLENGGNVGIGTGSPSRLLDVDGIQGWSEGTNVEKAYLNPTGTGTDFNLLGDNGNIRFDSRAGSNSYINTGNVGIGTTSPAAKLNVNGNVKIEGTNALLFGGSASIPSWAINHSGSDLLIDDQGGNTGSVLFNNSEGVALPRLTTTEINAISSPAQGLMTYNTTLNTICFYNGSSWQKVSHTNM